MSSSSDISISFGADLSMFLHSMREMIESVKTTMAEIRNHFAEVNRAGKEAKQAFIYAADGSEILLDKSKKATNSVKSQDKAWADCSQSIQKVVQNARKVSPVMNGITATLKTTQREWTDWAEKSTTILNSFRIVTATISTAANAIRSPLAEFSRFEDTATRLAPLVGGLEAAKQLCEELRDEAANGTMSFKQLTSVAGRLSTVFSNSADVKTWTTAFHDLSAGAGLDVNELVGNFVKSKSSERFEAGLMDMFAQKDVNIFPELEKQTGVAETELRKMAAAGTLSFAEVEKAILAVSTGTGQFAGQASKMSDTFGGSVGTMIAHWKILLAEFAKPIAETVTPWIQDIGKLFSENKEVANTLGTAFIKLGPAVALFAGVLVTAKIAMAAFNVVAMANPFIAWAAGIAAVGIAIYNFLPEAKSLTDMVTKSNREWEDSLKSVKRAYEDLRTDEQLAARIKQDKRELSDKEAAFREANPDFDVRRAETMQWRLEAHYRATGGGWLDDALFENAHGYSVEEAERQTAALLEYNAILKRKDELKSLAETTKARIKAAKAKAEENKATEESVRAAQRATEAFRALNEEQAKKAASAELDAAAVSERPERLLWQHGFLSPEALDDAIETERAQLNRSVADKNATEEQVSGLRRLIEAREAYNKLVNEAKTAEQAASEKAAAANKAYERRMELVRAEVAGNRELVELKHKQEDLTAEYKAAGMEDAEARAAKVIEAEYALKKANERPADVSALGAGTVSSEQASVGGGRSLSIGMSGAIDVARNQLNVAQKMRDLLAQVVENTAAPASPARIL